MISWEQRNSILLDRIGKSNLLYIQSAISRELAESMNCPLARTMEDVLDEIAVVNDDQIPALLLALHYTVLERNVRFGFDVSTTFCEV